MLAAAVENEVAMKTDQVTQFDDLSVPIKLKEVIGMEIHCQLAGKVGCYLSYDNGKDWQRQNMLYCHALPGFSMST